MLRTNLGLKYSQDRGNVRLGALPTLLPNSELNLHAAQHASLKALWKGCVAPHSSLTFSYMRCFTVQKVTALCARRETSMKTEQSILTSAVRVLPGYVS